MRRTFAATLLSLAVGMGSAYAADVVVNIRPPRAVAEHRDRAPSRDHVWVPGYHRWDGRAYVWERGHWERPPRPHAHWVAPRWDHRGNGWVFREGRWK
jgi:WXXGXW repeat (2 copies)